MFTNNGNALADVGQAAVRLFAARRRHTWPPVVSARAGWEDRYAEEATGVDVIAALDEAVAWVNQLIADIDAVGPSGKVPR